MTPKGWEEKKFTDIIQVNPRRIVPKGSMVKFVEMAAVSENFPSVSHIIKRKFEGSGSKFQNNDTLFARITPCAENGKTSFVDYLENSECGAGSTEFIVLSPTPFCIPKFLYFLVRWDYIRSFALSNMEGTSGRQRVPARVFCEILLKVPPLPEQKRIAEILTSVDDAIQATEKVIEQTKKVKQGLLQELLTRGIGHTKFKMTEIGEIPESWVIKKLSQTCRLEDGRRKPLKNSIRSGMSGKYPYYGASGIIDYINNFIFDEPRILLGEDGENIISRNLPLAFIATGKYWVNNHAHVINPLHNDILFICEYLESLCYKSLSTGSAQPKLNAKVVNGIPVPIPPIDEQKKIGRKISDINEQALNEMMALRNLKKLKSGLMQDLLTGRVRVGGLA